MTPSLKLIRVGALSTLLLGVIASSSVAQTTTAGGAQTGGGAQGGGPMTLERMYNGVTIAPEVRATKFNGGTAWLMGGYGGYTIDNTFLVGAGGYWQTNGSYGDELHYFGGVVEWLQYAKRPIGFSVRGLIGGGSAELTAPFAVAQPRGMYANGRPYPTYPTAAYYVFHEDFFVAEPQASVLVNFNPTLCLNAGVGYRAVAGGDSLNDRIRGVSGSVALEVGLFGR